LVLDIAGWFLSSRERSNKNNLELPRRFIRKNNIEDRKKKYEKGLKIKREGVYLDKVGK